MKYRLLAGLLVITGFGSACSNSRPVVEAAGNSALASSSSQSYALKATATADQSFVASGPLVVENQVDVAAQREGVVSRILKEPGARVHSGDLLAELDDRQVVADLEAAKARTRSTAADLHNWEAEAKVLDADLQRAEKLWAAGLITKEVYDHTRYKAESDHWDVERVKEQLSTAEATERSLILEVEKTQIRAPFDGIVVRRYVRAGQKIDLGDRMFWVSAESPLRLRFTLPESFLGHVSIGQQLELTSPDIPALKQQTRVIEVSPVVDPSSGTIEVLTQLIGPAGGLRPGMQASVRVPSPK